MAKSTDYRKIRVFLSSTFQDMKEERDALVKLFRQLAVEGRKQRISITLLDLRWGITDDQKRNGLVISTCLQEIDNSRPFFIGLIGERYGWVPSKEELGNADLLVKFPRLEYYADQKMSITEMEMRYGVLEADSSFHSLFLQKDGIKPENQNHKALIRDIEASPHTSFFKYHSIDSLVEIVKREFANEMMGNLGVQEEENEHDRIKNIQESIIYRKSENYIDISDYKKRIDNWVLSADSVLAIVGERGCGKTTLISSWITESEDKFDKIIYYFVGEENTTTEPVEIQKFFIAELECLYNMDIKSDETPDDLTDDFCDEWEDALKQVGQKGEKLLMVIDGLDHIEAGAINKLLMWLPQLPPNVKMLLSTIEGDLTFNSLTETKQYPLLRIADLDDRGVIKITQGYLNRFGKNLDHRLVSMIARTPIYHRNSMLTILLDDLVAYGVHELLPAQVERYARAQSDSDFFELIIERAEEFYEKDKIKKLLLSLLLSKNGLEEEDLRMILNLTPIEWSELYCGLVNYLIFVEGKYQIRYPELIEAAETRYSDTNEEEILALRRNMVSVIKEKKGEESEIAFQAYQLNDIDLLHTALAPYDVMYRLLIEEEMWFSVYWKELQNHGYSFREYLERLPKDKDKLGEEVIAIVQFINIKLEDFNMAIEFLDTYQNMLTDSKDDLFFLYLLYSNLYGKNGDVFKADEYMSKAEEIIGSTCDNEEIDLCYYYFILAKNQIAKEEYEDALQSLEKSLRLSKKDKYHEEADEWNIFNLMGITLISLKRYDKAIENLNLALKLVSTRMTSLLLEPSQVINNIGYCYMEMGRYDMAEEYLAKAVNQYYSIFGEPNLEFWLPLTNLAELEYKKEEFGNAEQVLNDILAILDSSDHSNNTQYHYVYSKLGEIALAVEDYKKAIKSFKKGISVMKNDGFPFDAYAGLAQTYAESNNINQAIDVLKEMDKHARSFFDQEDNYASPYAMENMGYLYLKKENTQKAVKLFLEALEMYRLLGSEEDVNEIQDFLEPYL